MDTRGIVGLYHAGWLAGRDTLTLTTQSDNDSYLSRQDFMTSITIYIAASRARGVLNLRFYLLIERQARF